MKSEILRCIFDHSAYSAQLPLSFSNLGHPLDLEFEASLKPEMIRNRKPTLWRYREAIPISNDLDIVSMDEGFTPLLSLSIGGRKVWVKQDQLFSSGSYKDRGATVLLSKIKSLGIQEIIQDSSGNAGAAVAAYAALAQIHCKIFLPESTSTQKIKQIENYGADLVKIPGDRTQTAIAAFEAAKKTYYASHVYNPYFLHGTKTFAYEVVEQLNWKVPDAMILPAGNGTLLLGCFIGFSDLIKSGIIDRMPKLIAVQSELCSPLYQSFHGLDTVKEISSTIAEGIAIPQPKRLQQMVEAVRSSGGLVLCVSENEILETYRECGLMGFYIEPTSAATIAGYKQYIKNMDDTTIVTLFSGHGLKK